MNKLFNHLLVGSSLFFNQVSVAEDLPIDLFDLSLEQLMKLKVSVSSNYQQSLHDSPGIVRIIDKEMIAKRGWRDLQQLLLHIPGVQVSISKNGHTNLWMRGVQNRNNNKVLLLIDDVPQNDSYYGNFHIANQLPMEQIERVEVLNGPGGVVHGANSFAGVIAITTTSKGGRIGGGIGQQESYTSAANSESVYDEYIYGDYNWKTDLGNFYLFANASNKQGFQPQYNRAGEFYPRDVDSERLYILGKYKYESLNLQLNYSDYQYPYRFTKSDRWQGYDKQLFTLSGNYLYQLTNDLQLKLSAFYKDYDFSRPKTSFEEKRVTSSGISLHNTSETGIDAILLWPISTKQHVSMGISFDKDWARETFELNTDFPVNGQPVTEYEESLLGDPSRNILGLFTEYQQQIFTDHWLHLGLRYDNLSDFDNQVNYRLSLTRETEKFYYKALFGTSYRIPSYREYLKKYSETYTQKNPLQPEQIETIELAVGFTPAQHEVLFVWYINQYQDFIKEVSINSVDGIEITTDGGDDEYAFNFEEIIISGLEFSWNWQPSDDLSLNSSFSYLLKASETPGVLNQVIVSASPISSEKSDLLFLSDLTASFQVTYQFNSRYQLYWDLVYYSNRDVPDNYQVDSDVQQPNNADSFWLSNVYLESKVSNQLSLGLSINNLFDANIYSPALEPASDYDNQWTGRHIELSAHWQF